MHEKYLHEGERLLCSRRASPAVLMMSLLRGLLETLVSGAVVSILVAIMALFAGFSVSVPIFVLVFSLLLLFILLQHIRIWREATFRVTTERILLADPRAFFHAPLTTVKWPQYQESEVCHRQFLDLFFLARPLKIRYGTADARYEVRFPSLRYAEDLKHYLDKVDAAVRRNDLASLRPFVAKPRGKRDVE